MYVPQATASKICSSRGVVCTDGVVTAIDLKSALALYSGRGTLPDHTVDPFNTYDYAGMTITTIQCSGCTLLTGSLPVAWGKMKSLTEISFDLCVLTGTLPSEWSGLLNLAFLHLDANRFTGTLPGSWGSMVKLQRLYLNNNRLTGTLPPEWASLVSVKYLYAYRNQLSGTLPQTLPPNIQMFDVNKNAITGYIPLSYTTDNYPSANRISLQDNPTCEVAYHPAGKIHRTPSIRPTPACETKIPPSLVKIARITTTLAA
ncbi:hypothetical protein AGDE_12759 [Angomonas deanei]|uniref:Leucine rich repeat, putative n=1 Tax=Angomonas deanei TaxID=59799 RepID=A0A7G2C5H3_9TRYP|nr:hypothetical protein AGDE_12759 [Angomonas deanei]CAD2214745.1 Leucine rich repeat, putative [Angomonas deanei]|eukprot:EPY23845.1 hypothetical protein AGDE_12759 [Angomonas deanei]